MSDYQYQIGGCLAPNALTYVVRSADNELYQALKAGELCYVLSCHQMGKSSLAVKVSQRLLVDGFACAVINLSSLGSEGAIEQWYDDLMRSLVRSFRLQRQLNLRRWRKERHYLSALDCLAELLTETLPKLIKKPIVICLDEIESTLSLAFNSNDFFALIRACHRRGNLTFALLGVATPRDLNIDITKIFNIGRLITLNGFQEREVQPLFPGLLGKVNNPRLAIKKILVWTGGQPFLTQRLCLLLSQNRKNKKIGNVSVAVKKIAKNQIIDNWMIHDEAFHLLTISNRFTSPKEYTTLKLYQSILQQGAIAFKNSPEEWELLLSGLVVKEQKYVKVSNRIYERIFGLDWLEAQLRQLPPYGQVLVA